MRGADAKCDMSKKTIWEKQENHNGENGWAYEKYFSIALIRLQWSIHIKSIFLFIFVDLLSFSLDQLKEQHTCFKIIVHVSRKNTVLK